VDDETIYAWLESGRLEFVATVEKLTKGWDCPPVEVIMLLKPWRKARANYVQACGRGKRIAPGKSMSWVIDAGGNIERFGLLERQPHPELEHSRKSKGKQESLGLPTGKRCPGCGAVVALDCLLCQCGHEWPPLPPEELVKLQGFAGYRALSMEELEAVTTKTEAEVKRLAYVKLAVEAYRRGHKPGWAAVRYKDQFEVWPSWQVKRGAVFGRRPLPSDVYAYRAYLARFDKGEEWIDKQIRAEFGDAPPVEGEALSA
jgi:superfamily II DNA or RNA helicase